MGAGATSLFMGQGSAVQGKRCRNAMEVGAGNQLLEMRLVRGGRGGKDLRDHLVPLSTS